MRRSVRLALVALAWFALVPAAAFAQASITGVVRDTSGAVLPGVTVEVSSPVLIEKVRSAVTDDAGQYRVERRYRHQVADTKIAARVGRGGDDGNDGISDNAE